MNQSSYIAALTQRIAKLEKINAVLMDRVEFSNGSQTTAYSLFQTAIGLERQVISRTNELTNTLQKVERLNEQLSLAKEIAEQANRSKTRFLAQAGHDLLQPVNAATLAIAALADIARDEKSHRLIHQVERSLSNIDNLLKSLLDISKLDAGVLVPQVTSVSLDSLLRDIANDYTPFAQKRGLSLRVRTAHVYVSTDRSMLIRILQNLVSNALRYTQTGRVLVGVRRHPGSIHLEVYDTGPGIAKDQHALIFQEFHRCGGQAIVNDFDLGPGLGLGLSIVQRLVDLLGHRISIRSQLGRGTHFSVELPRVNAPVLSTAALTGKNASMGWGIAGAVVVVIDNDAAVRDMLTSLISRWHGLVIAACNGAEATRIVTECKLHPNLLLVDYHLNDETGLEAIAQFSAEHGDNLPAIVVTGDYDTAVEACVTSAGFELLHKPVRPAELRALMTHILG